jgi:GT2 family glycosyltransferase
MSGRPVTVSVTTRNRPDAVERCIRSLSSIRDLVDCAIVLDDASVPALDVARLTRAADEAGITLEVVRADTHQGTAAGKNTIARRARAPYLLSLDDDAFLVGDASIRGALNVLEHDPEIAAVAFSQADEHGRRFPAGQQPAAAEAPCYVPAFIGFACLIARERLLEIGGYREAFVIHGEEREVCLRWLDRGLHVVYLPSATVAHVADASNRDHRAYVRHVMRNDCLAALYNEPFVRVVAIIPYKLWSFTRMRAGVPGGDPGGLRWMLRELARSAPAILRERHPVRWRTLREWRRLRALTPPYPGAMAAVPRRDAEVKLGSSGH